MGRPQFGADDDISDASSHGSIRTSQSHCESHKRSRPDDLFQRENSVSKSRRRNLSSVHSVCSYGTSDSEDGVGLTKKGKPRKSRCKVSNEELEMIAAGSGPEARKAARQLRNRASAAESRRKKELESNSLKQRLENLEMTVERQSKLIEQQKSTIERLTCELETREMKKTEKESVTMKSTLTHTSPCPDPSTLNVSRAQGGAPCHPIDLAPGVPASPAAGRGHDFNGFPGLSQRDALTLIQALSSAVAGSSTSATQLKNSVSEHSQRCACGEGATRTEQALSNSCYSVVSNNSEVTVPLGMVRTQYHSSFGNGRTHAQLSNHVSAGSLPNVSCASSVSNYDTIPCSVSTNGPVPPGSPVSTNQLRLSEGQFSPQIDWDDNVFAGRPRFDSALDLESALFGDV